MGHGLGAFRFWGSNNTETRDLEEDRKGGTLRLRWKAFGIEHASFAPSKSVLAVSLEPKSAEKGAKVDRRPKSSPSSSVVSTPYSLLRKLDLITITSSRPHSPDHNLAWLLSDAVLYSVACATIPGVGSHTQSLITKCEA